MHMHILREMQTRSNVHQLRNPLLSPHSATAPSGVSRSGSTTPRVGCDAAGTQRGVFRWPAAALSGSRCAAPPRVVRIHCGRDVRQPDARARARACVHSSSRVSARALLARTHTRPPSLAGTLPHSLSLVVFPPPALLRSRAQARSLALGARDKREASRDTRRGDSDGFRRCRRPGPSRGGAYGVWCRSVHCTMSRPT